MGEEAVPSRSAGHAPPCGGRRVARGAGGLCEPLQAQVLEPPPRRGLPGSKHDMSPSPILTSPLGLQMGRLSLPALSPTVGRGKGCWAGHPRGDHVLRRLGLTLPGSSLRVDT